MNTNPHLSIQNVYHLYFILSFTCHVYSKSYVREDMRSIYINYMCMEWGACCIRYLQCTVLFWKNTVFLIGLMSGLMVNLRHKYAAMNDLANAFLKITQQGQSLKALAWLCVGVDDHK